MYELTNVLVGDIGGTKTILALYSAETGPYQPRFQKTYASAQYASLEAIVREFLPEANQPVGRACFAVAGPVVDGRAQITNLPWVVDAARLAAEFSLSHIALLNDLEAVAAAVPILRPEDLHTLSAGKPAPAGNRAVVAPGTGLGEAFLTCTDGRYHAHASEGSHVSFGPVGELQIGLLRYMNQQGFGHVSFERVCSGGLGVPHLYAYLKSIQYAEEPAWLAEKLAGSDDPTPIVFEAAQDPARPCPLAAATLDLFVAILGAECGNLALKVLATGGIYLGGGISPRILAHLQLPAFLEALRDKGRFREILTQMPVHVILNPQAGLLGAAAHGLSL
ncbi:MAG: glucokinase [Anaerolineales bacterium]|nr:glucokinase [Anaerolineales bacterium]